MSTLREAIKFVSTCTEPEELKILVRQAIDRST